MPEFTVEQINAKIKSDKDMIQLAEDDPTEFKSRAGEIYKRFGYNPDGKPMPAARRAIRAGSRALGISEDLGEGVAAAPLPILGGVAGAALGAIGGSVPGGLAGGVAGSMAGEMANAAVGITEPPSAGDLALSGGGALLGPGVGRAGSGLVKGLKRLVPGMGAGLNEYAGEQLVQRLVKMRVTKADVDIFRKDLEKVENFEIPVPKLKELLQGQHATTSGHVLRGAKSQEQYETRLKSYLDANPDLAKGKMSARDLMGLEDVFNLEKGNFPEEVWGRASATIIDEMETALTNPKLYPATKGKIQATLTKFKNFIAVNNKFKADESITKAMQVDGSILKSVPNDPDLVRFDKNAFKKFINNDKAFTKAFPESERKAIAAAIEDLGYISRPPAGNADAVNLAKRYGGGGMIGWYFGGPAGALVGAGIEEGVRNIVTTPAGRQAVKYLAKQNRGRIDMLEVTKLSGQIAAGMGAGAVPGITGRTGGGMRETSPSMPIAMENQE